MSEINKLKKIERDENGLIKDLVYVYNSDGGIDWKSMIPKQFLYINPDAKRRDKIEKEYGKAYDELDPIKDNIKDSDLVILLNGLRHLLYLRGHNYVKLIPIESREDFSSVNCEISFIPSYESEGREIIHQDNACATPRNTNSFAQNYLLEIASNRAFCRCIRSFLKIQIVSKEELGATISELEPIKVDSTKNIKMLKDIMEAKNVNWDTLVEKMKKEGKWDDSYKTISDLPNNIIFDFIGRLKKYAT